MMMSTAKSLCSFALIGTLSLVLAGGARADDDDDDDGGGQPSLPPFGPITLEVDCAAGDTIAGAIGAVFPGQEATIVLLGDCTEDVTIRKDGIALDGDPADSGIQGGSSTLFGGIRLEDAHRLAVRNLTVSNPAGSGIAATEGANFKVENAAIVENADNGVIVFDGATGSIRNSTVSNNGLTGIEVFNGAFARIENNVIAGNGTATEFGYGIAVSRAVVRANANQVTGNTYAALDVVQNGTYRTGPSDVREVLGPGSTTGIAMEIARQGYVDLRTVDVEGRITVAQASELDVQGTTANPSLVTSDIFTSDFAVVRLLRNVNATGSTFGCSALSTCSCRSSNICPTTGPP